jgi:hypothetical protein
MTNLAPAIAKLVGAFRCARQRREPRDHFHPGLSIVSTRKRFRLASLRQVTGQPMRASVLQRCPIALVASGFRPWCRFSLSYRSMRISLTAYATIVILMGWYPLNILLLALVALRVTQKRRPGSLTILAAIRCASSRTQPFMAQ